MKRAGAAVLLALVLGRVDTARADGAFPNAQSVLLASDQPREIILGTTFGLVFSEDDGATWRYACETAPTLNGRQYVLGAAPAHQDLRGVGRGHRGQPRRRVHLGAGWRCLGRASGAGCLSRPSDPDVAFALGLGPEDGLVSAYRSDDGGLTYQGPLFTSPPDGQITGIEVAAAPPRTLYVTIGGAHPALAFSADRGDTWTTREIDLGSTGDSGFVPSLAAVEPTDAARVYLRIADVPGDSRTFKGLAVTLDGGTTWKVPLLVSDGSLAGFARLDDGTLFAVGSTPLPGAPPVPAAFVSDDGAQSFTTRSLPVHALGLGQRDGTLFTPTNTAADGFALASSVDRGASWQPRLRFADIAGVKDCVHASCQQGCTTLAAAKLFPAATCGSSADASAGTRPRRRRLLLAAVHVRWRPRRPAWVHPGTRPGALAPGVDGRNPNHASIAGRCGWPAGATASINGP